ncbi:MAG: SNF2-related protein, partial [Cyanobacteria bacterium P01_F01_bin.42]
MPAQNLELDRETLHKRYQQLPSDEKIVLQLLSIIYEPAHINDLQACIDDLPKSISRTVSTAGLASQLKHLHKKLKLLQKCKHGHWRCDPLVVELVTRDLAKTKRLDRFVKAVGRAMPLNQHWRGGPMPRSFDQVMREVRIGLYTHDFDYVTLVFENSPLMSLGVEDDFSDLLFEIINNPFDIAWFKTLPVWFQINIVESQTDESTLDFANIDEVVTLLRELVEEYPSNDNLIRLLLSQLLYRGQFSEAQVLCETHSDTHHKSYYFGCIAAVTGQAEAACRHFKTSLKLKAKEQHRRSQDLEGIGGILLLTAGLRAKQLPWVRRQLTAMLRAEHVFADICELFEVVLDYHGGDLSKRHHVYQYEVLSLDAGYAIDSLFMAMGWYWILPEQAKQFIPILEEILDAAIAARYEWFAVETAHLLQRIDSAGDYLSQVQSFATAEQVAPIVDLIKPVAPWELCLSALTTLNQPADLTQSFNHGQRLVWLLSMTGQSWSLTPKEQKVTAKGVWSKGRAVSLKRLSESVEDLDYLTEQDRRICRCIETERVAQYDYYYYGSVNYVLEAQAIAELVGHPLVFWENAPDVKVELVAGEPEILVRQVDSDNLTLELSPQIYDDASHIVEKETLTRVKVIAVKPEHQRIATILGEQNSLQVPLEAKERVLEAINSISQLVTVQSDIGVGNEAIAEVPSSATPYLQLFPLNEGLNIKLLMRPFDQMGPYFAPGKGGKTVIAEIEGTRTLTNRDLEAESTRAQQVVDSCAVLQEIPPENHEWILDNPEDCLEVLLAAQSLEGQVVIEWPEGQSFKLKPQVDLANLNLSLMRQRDWFVVNGEVELDAEQVINLQQLMALLKDAKGRFLPLGKGQFLALTDTFRKRLEELQAVSEKHGKGMRLNPLASLAIEDWMDEVGNLKTDKHWKQHVKRLKDVRTLEPSLPSTLQAELRDYQIDGFKWLARLSAWGVGACLADDMGLGKTLQAIALILTRAPQGPALIVAPTSVGMNWISEAQRFAPTLNPIQFGSGDRQTMVDSLRSFDMLICTYGLLQRTEIAQMLSAVAWQVIVLDEAQAIKNSATKRSKAAMKLQ